jgi:membrane protease YdiL (CAAX protease family)
MSDDFEILPPELPDVWHRGSAIRLDGFTERHRFAPWFAASIVLLLCFVLFQAVIAPIALFSILAATGVDLIQLMTEITTEGTATLSRYTAQLLGANTIGLILAFGIPALLLARMSTKQAAGFLRLRACDWQFVALAVVGWVVLVPIVQYVGQLNASLPWPDWVMTWERQMLEPVVAFLENPGMLVPSLLMIALAPAICEELLFRGYIQRQFERSVGIDWSIALSGILFGVYHLQPTKVLPLALLGCYFAFLTWRSGSLLPAMVAHFCQNALAIVATHVFAKSPDRTPAQLDEITTPWFVALLAVVILMGVVYLFTRRASELLTAREASLV